MMVFITGACGGLGRAFASECAQRGFDLFLTDINEAGLASIYQGITRQYPASVFYKTCDITKENEVDELFEYIDESGIRFDMLLNLAGIDFEGAFSDTDCGKLLSIVRLNIEATILMTQSVFKRRREGSRFYEVIVSSLACMYPMPLKATYAASKRFLFDFSIAVRREMRNRNCSMLVLCPAGLPTTKEAVSGILAQGFWGMVTTSDISRVVSKTISKCLANKHLYIPGIMNQVLYRIGSIIPRTAIADILYRRWDAAQRKWLTS